MKALIVIAALAAAGCASVTFNGQRLQEAGAAAMIGAVAAALLIEDDDEAGADKGIRCPGCPPIEGPLN